MSDKRTLLWLAALASSLWCGAGCVTPETKTNLTVVGSSSHVPYPAKPEYLGTRALPDPDTLKHTLRAAGVHASAPAIDTSGDDSDPGVAESADDDSATAAAPAATQPAPQQGGSFTVAPSNEAPLPNRLPDVQQPWQPTINAGNPPQDPP